MVVTVSDARTPETSPQLQYGVDGPGVGATPMLVAGVLLLVIYAALAYLQPYRATAGRSFG